jgi:hypothetical protein
MAKEKEDEVKNQVATTSGGSSLPADFMEDVMADAGSGVSQNADDNVLPFLALLQDLNPEVKKRDPNYVEGAEPGFIYNQATRQLWNTVLAPGEEKDGHKGDELLVQPCAFHRCVVEWIPRDAGGGFVARHDPKPGETIDQMLARIGKQVADPKDSSGDKKIWVTPDGKHELRDTRYHYVNILQPDGTISPAVMSFSSTGHTPSREWMTLMNNFKIKVGDQMITAPSWSKKYRVRTRLKQNKKGEFFVHHIEDAGIITDKSLRELGKQLNRAFQTGEVKPDMEKEGSVAGEDGQPPI